MIPPSVVSDSTVGGKAGENIGPYRLLEQIGEGGMGTVWMAEQAQPIRRQVALKIVKLGMDTRQVVARFEAERQALALMDHPYIAKVFDAGATSSGRPYFVMELVRGVRITNYCNQHHLPTKERLALFVQVCHAIQHAHQKGVIHRDIKPSNVLVTLHDGVPVPKVIDFGIAKATSDQPLTDKTIFTALAQFIGTPAYMSPEQAAINRPDIDTRSDIYTLGVLLYELLTGETPFDAKRLTTAGLDEIRRIIREEEPPRPSTRLSTLTEADLTSVAKNHQSEPARLTNLMRGDLDWIVMRCLEKDRARRYETANGLAADVQRHLRNEPVAAGPPSNLYRFQKMVRRNGGVFAAGAAVVAALVIGLSVATSSYFSERRATAKEQQSRQRAEEAALGAKTTLSAAHFRQAGRLIADQNWNDALAFLAASLSANPTNQAALTQLSTLLTYHSWRRPEFECRGRVLEVAPKGRRFVTANGKTASLWDLSTFQLVGQHLEHAGQVFSAKFSLDGKWLVTIATNSARVWDASTGRPITPPLHHSQPVSRAELSRDGDRILTVAGNFSYLEGLPTLRVWDAQTGRLVAGPFPGFWNGRIMAEFSPDGTRFLIGTTNALLLYDARTGRPAMEPLLHDGLVFSASFSPDGKRLITSAEKSRIENVPGSVGSGIPARNANSRSKGLVSTVAVWDSETGKLLHELSRVDGTTSSAQFSPDGKRVLIVASNIVGVWDAQTGQSLAQTLRLEDRNPRSHFSPNGERFITISSNLVHLCDARTGEKVKEPLRHGKTVKTAQFSSDGMRLITVSYDGRARLWDAQNGQLIDAALQHGNWVDSADFSPEGKWILTSSEQTVRLWDARGGQAQGPSLRTERGVPSARFTPDRQNLLIDSGGIVRMWRAPTAPALPVPMEAERQLSPDGIRFLTVATNTVRLWDARTDQPLTESLKHEGVVDVAEFSPNGRRFVTATTNLARVWDAETGRSVGEPLNHDGVVFLSVFSSDGKRLLTSVGSEIWLWDAEKCRPLLGPLRHESKVTSARFSPAGDRLVSYTTNGWRLWNPLNGNPLTGNLIHPYNKSPWSPSRFPASPLSISSNWTRMLYAGSNTVRIWNLGTGQELSKRLEHNGKVHSAFFSSDGRWIATVSGTNSNVTVWNSENGKSIAGPLPHFKGIAFVQVEPQFAPDGKRIMTCPDRKTLQLWDLRTAQPVASPLVHPSVVSYVRFSPDGQRLITGTSRFNTGVHSVYVWNVEDSMLLAELPHFSALYDGKPRPPVFSPDERRFVTSISENMARVWDAQTGQPVGQPLVHGDWFRSIEFSKDGRRIVTGSDDKTARVWDAESGLPLTEALNHNDRVRSAIFHPDGKRIITVSGGTLSNTGAVIGGTTRLWDIAPSELECPAWLPELAEAISGLKLNPNNTLEPSTINRAESIRAIRQQLNRKPNGDDWTAWGRWYLADSATRTVSPFSKMTIYEYIEACIQENTPESLAEAEKVAEGNTALQERISRVRMVPKIRLSRDNDRSYARLVQAGFDLRGGERYRFSCRVVGSVRFGAEDQVPEFWRDGVGGRRSERVNEEYREHDGWTDYQCLVEVKDDGKYDLVMALWNSPAVEFTTISLRPSDLDVELVRNGNFNDDIRNWTTKEGRMERLPKAKTP